MDALENGMQRLRQDRCMRRQTSGRAGGLAIGAMHSARGKMTGCAMNRTPDRYLGGRSLNRLNRRRVGGDGRPARGIRWPMVTHDDFCLVPMIRVMMVMMVMIPARATKDPKGEASRIGGARARGQNHRRKNDRSRHFSFALGSRRSVSMMRRLRSSLVARDAISFSSR